MLTAMQARWNVATSGVDSLDPDRVTALNEAIEEAISDASMASMTCVVMEFPAEDFGLVALLAGSLAERGFVVENSPQNRKRYPNPGRCGLIVLWPFGQNVMVADKVFVGCEETDDPTLSSGFILPKTHMAQVSAVIAAYREGHNLPEISLIGINGDRH